MHRARKVAPVWKEVGTPELVAKKAAAVHGGNPALSVDPLGVMAARGLITKEQYLVGQWFAGVRATAFGTAQHPLSQVAHLTPRDVRPPTTEEEEDERRIVRSRFYRQACEELRRCGGKVQQTVQDVCVHHVMPPWLDRPNGSVGYSELVRGLEALDRFRPR